jgi:hypothetical protein
LRAGTQADKIHITFDVNYGPKAINLVISSMYKPKCVIVETLRVCHWIELLRTYQFAYLLGLRQFATSVVPLVSRQLAEIDAHDATRAALQVFSDLKHQTTMSAAFGGEITKLQDKVHARKLEEQKNILMLLRNPSTRSQVSEEEYQRFLDWVQ